MLTWTLPMHTTTTYVRDSNPAVSLRCGICDFVVYTLSDEDNMHIEYIWKNQSFECQIFFVLLHCHICWENGT